MQTFKKQHILIPIFLWLNLLSMTVLGQKTATTIISDVLNMKHGVGYVGFRLQIVSPRDVKYAEFIITNSDIKSKGMTNLPNSPQIKYFANKAAVAQTFTNNNNSLLSLSQPGLIVSGTSASLGTFVYYAGTSEIKFNIPSTLSVLFPDETNSFNTLFGKTSITTKTANGQVTTVEDVIYIKITGFNIPG